MDRAVVYVQLQHDLPLCFWDSVKKTRQHWGGEIFLIAPERERGYSAISKYGLKFIAEEELRNNMVIEYERRTFFNKIHVGWDGFWDNACKRFIYLSIIQTQNNIREMLHFETDVVPYMDISHMMDKMGSTYTQKIVFSKHAQYQISCCTIYCNRIDLMGDFCKAILKYFDLGSDYFTNLYDNPKQTIINETHFAYTFYNEQKKYVALLPTTPYEEHYDKLGFLIDSTSWGMWVGGLHRNPTVRHASETHNIGREILSGKYDVLFSFENDRICQPYVFDKTTKMSHPLATLHFNSKRPDKWI